MADAVQTAATQAPKEAADAEHLANVPALADAAVKTSEISLFLGQQPLIFINYLSAHKFLLTLPSEKFSWT